MRIDLHTHSDLSDGTTSPAAVVRAAAAAGLDVVALTDHDTAEGWPEGAEAARSVGIGFVPGIEISCRHAGRSVHLLAYLPDAEHPALARLLRDVLEGRDQRMPQICAALRAVGVDIDEDDVRRQDTRAAATGRPHVADALVSKGVVEDRDEAFDRFLSPGRPGYVQRYAPPVLEAIDVVRAAGGAPVVAHPWGRGSRRGLDRSVLAGLADAGLVGLEVDHQDHDAQARSELRAIAADLDLVVTGSSDHHGAGKRDHDLGCNTTAPDQLDRLLSAAEAISAASGRRTPRMVAP